tara:strand:+ start:351 stop:1190 length:840 start_codon:yes stop_codon:yes gene_type:complete
MRRMKWGKGTVSCGLCHALGHNIRSCPHLEEVLMEAELISETTDGDIGRPHKYKPYQHIRALWEKKKREKRKPRPESAKPRRCSFCKMEGHTKRNCTFKSEVKDIFYEANAVWRAAFLKRAKEVGLGPGALIKIKRFQAYSGATGGWGVYKNVISLVTSAAWDELTFMNSYGDHWQYQSLWLIEHHLAIPDNNVKVKIGQPELKQFFGALFYADPLHNKGIKTIEIINKAPMPLDDAWVYNKEVKELDWLIAQHSLGELERDYAIIPLAESIIKNGIRP